MSRYLFTLMLLLSHVVYSATDTTGHWSGYGSSKGSCAETFWLSLSEPVKCVDLPDNHHNYDCVTDTMYETPPHYYKFVGSRACHWVGDEQGLCPAGSWSYTLKKCIAPTDKNAGAIGSNTPAYSACVNPKLTVGNPITIPTGNKFEQAVDYSSGGHHPLTVTRSYNSSQGQWRFFPSLNTDASLGAMTLTRSDGRQIPFYPQDNGIWVSDTDNTDSVQPRTDSTPGWTYHTATGMTEQYDAQGRITQRTYTDGFAHYYHYQDQSITLTDDAQRSIFFQLNQQGNPISFSIPEALSYRYQYDAQNNLTTVYYPDDGGTRIYHYENTDFPHALTGITDEKGTRYATWHYDSAGRAISSEHYQGIDKVSLYYGDLFRHRNVRVQGILGDITDYDISAVQGAKKISGITRYTSTYAKLGKQSYYYYSDPQVSLTQKTNWLGARIHYDYNNKGQLQTVKRSLRSRYSPYQTMAEFTWHNTLNKPLTLTTPGYSITYSYDKQGNRLSQRIEEHLISSP